MNKFKFVLVAAILFCFLGVRAQAGPIVLNGGFETGDFTNWVHGGWNVSGSGIGSHSGTQWASTGCVGSGCISVPQAYIYQDLATETGQGYNLSFYFASAGTPMELQVLFGGSMVMDLTGLAYQSTYSFYTTSVNATSSTTRLEFRGRQDPGWNALDDVSLDPVGIPEPSTWMLGLAGIAALLGIRRVRTAR